MNSTKIYFIDLDGTFVDKPYGPDTYTPQNLNALKKICKNKHIVFSTGRINSDFVLDLTNKVNAQYAICLNGALIVDKNNEIVLHRHLDFDSAQEVLKIFKSKNMFIYPNGIKEMYQNGNLDSVYMKEWAKTNPKHPYSKLDQIKEFSKLFVFGLSAEETKELYESIKDKFPLLSFYLVSNGTTIEVGPKGVNKGFSEAKVCKLLGIDPKDACHIGDSGNDVSSVDFLGKFICMDNSLDFVKQKAHHIGPNFANSGVAKLICHLEDIDFDEL
ncbi:HAD-IIB family hydrolase [Mycoplasmopsis mucosicanis]|nr:HAD-IIB family hydrolase [Mycoplasmopsis mucosicanis]